MPMPETGLMIPTPLEAMFTLACLVCLYALYHLMGDA